MFMVVFLPLFLLHSAEGANATISCINDQGNAVDWFYLYKLPHPHQQPPEEGLKYLLLEEQSEGWTEGTGLVRDITGALGRSLGPLYAGGELGYILYNDQPPEQRHLNDANSGGHTKGVVLFDSRQGFWLVHSTPHFPPPKTEGKFSYPDSGINNGQNFICVTYPLERFDTIGIHNHTLQSSSGGIAVISVLEGQEHFIIQGEPLRNHVCNGAMEPGVWAN